MVSLSEVPSWSAPIHQIKSHKWRVHPGWGSRRVLLTADDGDGQVRLALPAPHEGVKKSLCSTWHLCYGFTDA